MSAPTVSLQRRAQNAAMVDEEICPPTAYWLRVAMIEIRHLPMAAYVSDYRSFANSESGLDRRGIVSAGTSRIRRRRSSRMRAGRYDPRRMAPSSCPHG